jgi:hypothetical protein
MVFRLPIGNQIQSVIHGLSRWLLERSLLYQIVEEYYPAFVFHLAAQGTVLSGNVEREFEDYLKCGRLEHGFLRVCCDSCHAEHLVAFGCKRRVNLTSFHGVFAPHSKHRALVTSARRGRGNKPTATEVGQEQTPAERRASMNWAQRLERVFTKSRRFRRYRYRDLPGMRRGGEDHAQTTR